MAIEWSNHEGAVDNSVALRLAERAANYVAGFTKRRTARAT
jgi:hypothetical protein